MNPGEAIEPCPIPYKHPSINALSETETLHPPLILFYYLYLLTPLPLFVTPVSTVHLFTLFIAPS